MGIPLSEVTISQSTAALKMSTSLFPTRQQQHVYLCNTMDIDLIVLVSVHVPAMFVIVVPFPNWGYNYD